MKNKVIFGSLAATFVAFMLYTVSLRHVANTSVQIVNQKETVKKKKSKTGHEPNVEAVEFPTHVKVAPGSNSDWTKQIKKVMGKDQSYQVSVQDLNSGRFARVANSTKAHGVSSTSHLFLLATIYYQEEHGKLSQREAIKIKKADRVKGENILQPGIAYAVSFLKQSLLRGSKTAGNALLRKVKPRQINAVVKKMGATKTKFNKKYMSHPRAVTTAADLTKIMADLYQNKTLNRQYANSVLSSLHLNGEKPQVVKNITGTTIYAIGDKRTNVALVQGHGHAYCISVWSNSDQQFAKLGKIFNDFFK